MKNKEENKEITLGTFKPIKNMTMLEKFFSSYGVTDIEKFKCEAKQNIIYFISIVLCVILFIISFLLFVNQKYLFATILFLVTIIVIPVSATLFIIKKYK